MQFKKLHPNFQLPTKGSLAAGGYDIYMPEAGMVHARMNFASPTHATVKLGFAAKVPDGHVALIFPRSGAGSKYGVDLRNTCGIIDADYTGEWIANIRQKEGVEYSWAAGERILQFLVVPVADITPELVDELPTTERGDGGFGSSGK